MKHFRKVNTNKISWLNIKDNDFLGGEINDLYYPESISELVEIVRECQSTGREYYVFGHTSNSYFLPSFSPDVVIITLYLKGYYETADTITVECGMHTKVLAKLMIDEGCSGFEGLIDLPGTVSGAVYGNSGCYDCLISDRLISVQVLTPEGNIVNYQKENLGFSNRSSFFKEKIIRGIILTIVFAKILGNVDEIRQKAVIAHEDRIQTQPGPTNNLGSIFKKDELTTKGKWICRICRFAAKILHMSEHDHFILKLKLLLAGYPHLEKYLFDTNRFMWVDNNSRNAFNVYLQFRKVMYKYNEFEIEIYS